MPVLPPASVAPEPFTAEPISDRSSREAVAAPRDAGAPRPNGAASISRSDLLFMGVMLFVLGAMRPLADSDLPMHLALGEWIVRHRAVPFVEPFAWTRVGAPFFAYSWGVEVPIYLLHAALGPLGLRLLNGLLVVAAAASMLVLGRAAGWRPIVSGGMAAINVVIAAVAVPNLRPQSVLLILVPLGWALVYRALRSERVHWPVLGLVAVNAAAANTHLFFPIMAVPTVLVWLYPPRERWRIVAIAAAIVAGWMLSPYAPSWPAVFALNFTPNVLVSKPATIVELLPGFEAVVKTSAVVFVVGLSLLPWLLRGVSLTRREQLVAAGLWLVGLVAFAYAVRMLMVWWMLSLLPVAWALGRLPREERAGAARPAVRWMFYAGCVLIVVSLGALARRAWRFETQSERALSSRSAFILEPLAQWVDEHARPGSTGRIYTFFNAGSYLTWRLPGYSSSIDGRTIFPDSVAAIEAFAPAARRPVPVGPWRDADLAIVPTAHRAAALLDASPEWQRGAFLYNSRSARGDSLALWVRKAWWARAGRAPLAPGAVTAIDNARPAFDRSRPAPGR